MTFLIEHMLEEMDGAEEYCKAMSEATDSNAKRTFKELALGELSNFDKLAGLYQQKLTAEAAMHDTIGISDVWFKYFKHKADALKQKISSM